MSWLFVEAPGLSLIKEKSHPCNNGCVDCISSFESVGAMPPDTFVGGKNVVIGGYEPLLSPRIYDFVIRLKRQNPQSINLLTNGRILVYPKHMTRLLEVGVNRVFVKFFGADAKEHDAHTRVEGSFDQACTAVRQMRERGMVVNITFPPRVVEDANLEKVKNPYLVLAYSLTNTLPVVLPTTGVSAPLEPIQQSDMATQIAKATPIVALDHPGQYRYDLIWGNHTEGEGRWWTQVFPTIHILTGPMCNIKCLYCNVHGGDPRSQNLYDSEYVTSLLRHAAQAGLADSPGNPTVDFIGGEPTLHPELPKFVAKAKEYGFRNITICTNGVRLAQKGYLDSLTNAGLTGVRYSFHSHKAEVASALANAGTVADTYISVAKQLLNRSDIDTYFYRIILSNTIDDLNDYLYWLHEHNKTGKPLVVQLGLPSPRGRMFQNPELFPNLDRARDAVVGAIALGKKLGFDVTCHHAPGCIAPDDPSLAATNNIHARQVDARTNNYTVLNFEGDSRHASKCEECAFHEHCPGVPVQYFIQDEHFVEKWVRPFSADPNISV